MPSLGAIEDVLLEAGGLLGELHRQLAETCARRVVEGHTGEMVVAQVVDDGGAARCVEALEVGGIPQPLPGLEQWARLAQFHGVVSELG